MSEQLTDRFDDLEAVTMVLLDMARHSAVRLFAAARKNSSGQMIQHEIVQETMMLQKACRTLEGFVEEVKTSS